MGALADFLQGASNSAASTVTGPVDGLAWLLRKAGVPVGDAPAGGSAWAEQRGLMRPTQGTAGLLGEALGLSAPIVAAAKAPQIAGLLNSLLRGQTGKIEGAASRFVGRAPQLLPQRPFSHDYPSAPVGAASSQRLLADIEGRPLNPGATVFGRRVVGGVDEGAAGGDAGSIAAALNVPVSKATARELRSDVGRFHTIPGTILDPRIAVRGDLPNDKFKRVLEHEVGHAIDKLSGSVHRPGAAKELAHVYDALNNRLKAPDLLSPSKPKYQHTPRADGYPEKDWLDEQWAEAFRYYMLDPNGFKTIAPNAAAIIRKVVNPHPVVGKVVQFNSAAGAAILPALLAAPDEGTQ